MSVDIVGGSYQALSDFGHVMCFLFVELCDFVRFEGCGNEAAASCGENEMSMLLHEVQMLPENKDIAANCRQMTNGSVWHSQAEFFLCTLHTFFSERFVL